MSLVLDSGALIALDRHDRAMWRRLKAAYLDGDVPRTHGGVVGQAWRNGARQSRLAAAIAGMDVRPLDLDAGRAAGTLLARTKRTDVIDAALALLVADGDDLVTSDPGDLEALVRALGRHVEIIQA